MINKRLIKSILISVFCINLLLGLATFSIKSIAQSEEISLSSSTNLEMMEFTEAVGNQESNSSIRIPLPARDWNITAVNLNFTDIKLEREIKIIEDNATGLGVLDKEVRGLGVQIKLTEQTLIFGTQIYGAAPVEKEIESILVQIRGYSDPLNRPNDVIYGSTPLNMSDEVRWYDQIFDEPITLDPGNYYLVINGSVLGATDSATIYWFYNHLSPIYPTYYTSQYSRTLGVFIWQPGKQGSPYLHKLIQRENRTYYPEEINMTAEINGQIYNITDGIDLGTGNLIVENLDFSPNSSYLPIYLQNNNSVQLMFNLSYNLAIKHLFNSVGSMLIKAESNINWTLTPEINRLSNNYSIKFNYPEDWFSFNIFRDDQNITSQIVITENYLYFPNNIIIEGATWKIFAESIPIDVDLYVPKVAYEPDQVLKFSVLPPIFPGNITFKMIDPLGFPEHNDVMEILELTTEEIVLSHNLSSNPVEGTYQAAVFWNNYTAAGLRIQIFYVNIDLFPLLVITFSIIGAIAAVTSFTSYKVIKRVKRNREFYRKSIYNKYMDILNLEYIIVNDKTSGINVYDQVLASKTVDASLISGFLEAIRSFGIDLTGSNAQSQTVKLEYHDSKILMSEFKNFRLTLIMKDNPSEDFLKSINLLSYDIDDAYGKQLENFDPK